MTRDTAKRLTLHTSDVPHTVRVPSCVVKLDDTVDKFTNFVVIGCDNNTQRMTLSTTADAITMGQALMLLNDKFSKVLQALTPEDRAQVLEYLGG